MLSHVWLFVTPWTISSRLLCPQDFPGKNSGVGFHFLQQVIFPTQGSNLCLLHLLHWAGGFFTNCTTWEATNLIKPHMFISTYKYLNDKTRLGWRINNYDNNNVLSLRLPTLSIRIRWIRTKKINRNTLGIHCTIPQHKSGKTRKITNKWLSLKSSEEGNGNPLQYSCLGIPWTEETGGPQSIGLQRHGLATKPHCQSREGGYPGRV